MRSFYTSRLRRGKLDPVSKPTYSIWHAVEVSCMSVRRFLTYALIAAGVLPLLVFGLAFRSVLGAHIGSDIRSLSRSMLRTLSAQAGSSLLDGTRRDLPALLLLAEASPGRERSLLRSYSIPHTEYSRLVILDSSGRIEAAYPSGEGIAGRSYVLRAELKPGQVAFSGPFFSDLARSVVVEAAYSNGHETILALLDLGEISSKLVLVATSPLDRLGVVDGAGRYIACSEPSRAQRLEQIDPSFLVEGPARVKSEGIEYYASSARLPGTDWRVTYLRAASEADGPMTAFIGAIVVLVASAIVVTALVAIFAWRTISTPLGALVARIDLIADGRYSERVEGDFSSEFREIGRAFNAMADSIEKRDKELLRSEERYRLLFYKNRVPALIVDPASGLIRDANPAALSYYGYEKERLEALRLGDLDLTAREDLESELLAAEKGEGGRLLSRQRLSSGEIRDVELYLSPVDLGDRADIYCLVFDVTQRRMAEEKTARALEERTLLLREVYHRVKNNLQIISSLLNLQAEGIKEESALRALRLAQDRVFTMSLAHELVYQVPDLASVEASDYAEKILANLQIAYGAPEGSILTDLHPMMLALEKAVPFGLALNELASNAFKYAEPSASKPIRIALARNGEDGGAILSVEDSGPGISDEVVSKGGSAGSIGLSLIDALARQLGGEAQWGPGLGGIGTRAQIRFSIAAGPEAGVDARAAAEGEGA
jgi:PAS domain S-box-containing protein